MARKNVVAIALTCAQAIKSEIKIAIAYAPRGLKILIMIVSRFAQMEKTGIQWAYVYAQAIKLSLKAIVSTNAKTEK
jgi:hypothetical protein